jgi:hypothetical protein
MVRHALVLVLTALLFCIAMTSSRQAAAEWAGFMRRPLLRGVAPASAATVPGPKIRPKYVEVPAYGANSPTFRWGYFGAHPGAQGSKYRDYYGDYRQWTFRFAD